MWLGPGRRIRAQRVDHLKQKRRRGGAADKGGVSAPIEISDPDGEDIMIEDRDRPGVAKSMGRAGLPKYLRVARRISIR